MHHDASVMARRDKTTYKCRAEIVLLLTSSVEQRWFLPLSVTTIISALIKIHAPPGLLPWGRGYYEVRMVYGGNSDLCLL